MSSQGVEKRDERRSGKAETGKQAEFTRSSPLSGPAFFDSFQRSIIASQ
jgi:hypothetical protein